MARYSCVVRRSALRRRRGPGRAPVPEGPPAGADWVKSRDGSREFSELWVSRGLPTGVSPGTAGSSDSHPPEFRPPKGALCLSVLPGNDASTVRRNRNRDGAVAGTSPRRSLPPGLVRLRLPEMINQWVKAFTLDLRAPLAEASTHGRPPASSAQNPENPRMWMPVSATRARRGDESSRRPTAKQRHRIVLP